MAVIYILHVLKLKFWVRSDSRVPCPDVQKMPNSLSKYAKQDERDQ